MLTGLGDKGDDARMKVVITHSNADCDAFAAQIALQVLQPETRVVLSRRVSPRVHRFLNLHRDVFDLVSLDDIDVDQVDEIAVVDVRSIHRLGEHKALLARLSDENPPDVEIWDHHRDSEGEIEATRRIVESVGATTTMLVEQLQHNKLTLDPVYATLFSLGIHVDTGSLTYDTTTTRDISALRWLLAQGANLAMVETYLRLAFTEEQRRAFSQLLDSIEVQKVHGMEVGIGGVSLERGVDGLALVTTQALRLHRYGALFGAFHIRERKLQIVGRSRVDAIDVGRVMRALGGGGHAAAGATTIKTEDPYEVIRKLREELSRGAPATQTIEPYITLDIPSVAGSMSIAEAGQKMRERESPFVFVEEGGEFIGSFDMSFVRKASADGRSELPVKSSMHHHVASISSKAPLERAIDRFEQDNPGLLLVKDEEDTAVGALSRVACMRAQYTLSR